MDRYSLYAPLTLEKREFCIPEPSEACPGCGAALALRHIYKALGLPQELKAKWRYPVKGRKGEGALLLLNKGRRGDGVPLEILIDNEMDLVQPSPPLRSEVETRVADGYSYVATACSSYPFDLRDKLIQAQKIEGKVFLQVLSPCPVGWGFNADLTVKVGFWAVETRYFPLYEVVKGVYRITIHTPSPRPLSQYLKIQERFKSLSESEIKGISISVNEAYARLLKLSEVCQTEVIL